VLQLHLAVELDLALRDASLLAVAHRIPKFHAVSDARESFCVGHAVKGSLLATDRQHSEDLLLRNQPRTDSIGDTSREPRIDHLRRELVDDGATLGLLRRSPLDRSSSNCSSSNYA